MPLTMKLDETPDMGGSYRYVVRSGGLVLGMIEQLDEGPSEGAWQWVLTLNGPPDFVGGGIADTLDQAKDHFRAAWQRWLEWARLKELEDREIAAFAERADRG
jgi:hypothetical protein